MRVETTTRELFTLDELGDTARQDAIEAMASRVYQWTEASDLASTIVFEIAHALQTPGRDDYGPGDFPGIDGLELWEWDVERLDITARGSLTLESAPALPWGMLESYRLGGGHDYAAAYYTDKDGYWIEVAEFLDEDDAAIPLAFNILEQAIREALHDGIVAARDELEYRCSEAAIIEDCEANEQEFTVDGRPA